MPSARILCLSFILFLLATTALTAQVRLPRIVRDSMVLQRDAKVKVWGWASKGEKINIRFNKKTYHAVTGDDGKWSVVMLPTKAGGPYTMDITGSNTITIRDILMGDVWLCAGQSNMVHAMDIHKERYAKEFEEANDPDIRQFLVPTLPELRGPAADFPKGTWKTATAGNIGKFSVVAYFFAKALYAKYHVPIGLINASVGGTPVEAWTSEEGLKAFPDIIKTIQTQKDTAYVNTINRNAQADAKQHLKKRTGDKGLTEKPAWYDTTYRPKNWHTINIPGYWEDQGIKDLDGVVWYRREINVPASMTGVPAKVWLGRIVDADALYVNGKQVGSTGYQYPQRRYQIPAGILKPGKNIFVVRVTNNGGKGGFVPDKPYYVLAGNQTIDLKGYWQYKVGEVYVPDGPWLSGISAQNQPAALFNGMVAPITNYAIKGVIWYQGESNAGRAEEYKKLLPALIADWRTQWKEGDIPFLYAQLPDFMEVNYLPSESGWAMMREAALQTLSVPNTGMAVTIGTGEWNDIHPDNKKPIGDRLALAARRIAYGEQTLVYSGPLYKSARVDGSKIIISFTNEGSGLVSSDGEPLSQFAIAGADKKFVWANAVIENNTVVVSNENVPNPLYVRYAWADNPDGANLANKEGLPASPFRTDQ